MLIVKCFSYRIEALWEIPMEKQLYVLQKHILFPEEFGRMYIIQILTIGPAGSRPHQYKHIRKGVFILTFIQ